MGLLEQQRAWGMLQINLVVLVRQDSTTHRSRARLEDFRSTCTCNLDGSNESGW